MFATQVDNKWYMGDYAGATAAADNAKKWTIASAIVSAVGIFIWMLFILIPIMMNAGAST